MASNQSVADFIIEQIENAGTVSARKMFGEYGVFCNGKTVALICNDQFFVKPTIAGRAYIGDVTEAAPYKGAKLYFLIDSDKWDDSDWLTQLIKITAAELPVPAPKKKVKKKL
jgi:TfoX/Sxy family transcriptional regulator of competence genes